MDTLTEDIVLLRMFTAEPARPSSNPVLSSKETQCAEGILSLEHESKIVDCLAFFAAVTENPEKVCAVCLERTSQPNACVIRIAANTGVPQKLISGFEELARALESCCLQQKEEQQGNQIQHIVLVMNRNRILCRLRSKHAEGARRSGRRAIVLRLRDLTQALGTSGMTRSVLAQFTSVVDRLRQIFDELEMTPSDVVICGGADVTVLKLLYVLDELHPFEIPIRRVAGFNEAVFQGQDSLFMTITKLRKYRAACEFLVRVARRYKIFESITICPVTIPPANARQVSMDRTSFADTVARLNLQWTGKVSKKLDMTWAQASGQFQAVMTSLAPKVHAEIQLLFYYEMNPQLSPPRVICASKAACFLCDLFIRTHGQILVVKSHGVLYRQWTLPSIERSLLGAAGAQGIHETIKEFMRAIERRIRVAWTGPVKKRMHPGESFASLISWTPSENSMASHALPAVRTWADSPINKTIRQEDLAEDEETTSDIPSAQQSGDACAEPVLSHSHETLTASPGVHVDAACKTTRHNSPQIGVGSELAQDSDLATGFGQPSTGVSQGAAVQSTVQLYKSAPSRATPEGRLRHGADANINGHESRSCIIHTEGMVSEASGHRLCSMHPAIVMRKIDFHDEKLCLILELPEEATFAVSRCLPPQLSSDQSIVDIASLLPGQEMTLDATGLDGRTTVIIASKDQFGKKAWWEIMWKYQSVGVETPRLE